MNSRRFAFATAFICAGTFLWFSVTARWHPAVRSGLPDNALKVGFQVGHRAPEFALRSLDGSSVKLSDLRGKPVLLNFWATWCAPCRVEMPWLVELDQRYRTQGLQIVGVSMDDSGSKKEVAAFVTRQSVQYQILLGDSATADEYGGVRFMPQSFFIDSDGKITKTTTGLTAKQGLEDGAKALLTTRSGSPLAQGAPLTPQSVPNDAPGSKLKIGNRIPELSGIDQFGKHQDFDSLKGKNGLVLLFFRSADC